MIVRRLGAVEGLGSCTLIATDKTGTLTCNELTVRAKSGCLTARRFTVTGEGFVPIGDVQAATGEFDAERQGQLTSLAIAAVLCNEADLHERDGAWAWRGDPTDVALALHGAQDWKCWRPRGPAGLVARDQPHSI